MVYRRHVLLNLKSVTFALFVRPRSKINRWAKTSLLTRILSIAKLKATNDNNKVTGQDFSSETELLKS